MVSHVQSRRIRSPLGCDGDVQRVTRRGPRERLGPRTYMTVSECEAQRGVTNEVCGLGIQPENRPLSPPVRDLHREGEAVTAAGLGTPRWACTRNLKTTGPVVSAPKWVQAPSDDLRLTVTKSGRALAVRTRGQCVNRSQKEGSANRGPRDRARARSHRRGGPILGDRRNVLCLEQSAGCLATCAGRSDDVRSGSSSSPGVGPHQRVAGARSPRAAITSPQAIALR